MSNEVKPQVVIALMGPKGSGKDTVADLSIEKMGAIGKIATASFLKEMCSKALHLSLESFTDGKDKPFIRPLQLKGVHIRSMLDQMDAALSPEIKKLHKLKIRTTGVQKFSDRIFNTPREVLQFVGTEMIQSIFKSFHCVVSYDQIRGLPGVWFITDLRFLHEAEYARSIFPLLYFVRINGRAEVTEGKEEHSSESDWKSITPFVTIENTGSIEDLTKKCANVFNKIQEDVRKRFSSLTAQDWKKMTCPPEGTVKIEKTVEIQGVSNNPNISFVYQDKNNIPDIVPIDL